MVLIVSRQVCGSSCINPVIYTMEKKYYYSKLTVELLEEVIAEVLTGKDDYWLMTPYYDEPLIKGIDNDGNVLYYE